MKNRDSSITNILIIDSDPATARTMLPILARRSIHGAVAISRNTVNQMLANSSWHGVFICDNFDSRQYALKMLSRIRSSNPELPIICITDNDSSRQAVRAMKYGATDCIGKPLSDQSINEIIDEYFASAAETANDSAGDHPAKSHSIIGTSAPLAEAIDIAVKAAPTSAPILITGPSGTGKELLANLIHSHSRRADGPFIKVNCAALNESLLQSELFGHEKGAFTGAVSQHKGKFERAHNGTLLLDEITETGPNFQAQLLRVLENSELERVGGKDIFTVNVRVVCTSNRDILSEVRKGNFREDLYYRIAAIRLRVPALAERKEDIKDLCWHFIRQFAPETGRQITDIDPVTLDIFRKYCWPGNIRQLRNVVRTAMILGSGPILSLDNTSWIMDELKPEKEERPLAIDFNKTGVVDLQTLERHAIIRTLEKTDGNQTRAAKLLGISGRTLREKVKRYRNDNCFESVTL